MVDFSVAKKSPVHISICAGLNIVGTTTAYCCKHLTTNLVISLESLFLLAAILFRAMILGFTLGRFTLIDATIPLA